MTDLDNIHLNPVSETDQEMLDNWFSYHAPVGDQALRYEAIRAGGKVFATLLIRLCPATPERSTALRMIREAVYSANASIACNKNHPK